MLKLAFIALTLPFAIPVHAAQYGLGVGFNEHGTLYFPIKTERFMFEPFLAYFKDDSDEPSFYTDKVTELGIGIFLRSQFAENVSLYYGGRVSLHEEKTTFSTLGSEEGEATVIAPTLGAEYSPIPNFSIGIEHRINFLSGEQEDFISIPSPPFAELAELDQKRTFSETSVIARLFF